MSAPRHIALLPAAGSGSRMGSDKPKQYLPLLGKPLLWHTLAALNAVPEIDRVVLVLSPDDTEFDRCLPDLAADATVRLALQRKLAVLRCGGASRAETVRNGLEAIVTAVSPQDWVLVHDVARPCIAPADVSRLIATLADDPVGGILAVPVADTLKRSDGGERIAATVPRAGLWRAQTPQMFRQGMLLDALRHAADDSITDEASAIEASGQAPKLVPGSERNIKVTYPDDLVLAAMYLQNP
jgi:2-C-methyl-D-erythritol 4-phosphate cytidylyltransferase